MNLFVLVCCATAAVASSKLDDRFSNLTASKIEIAPNNTIQYLQFNDISYNLTDFTICTWIKWLNFSHTQTVFRLTGNKNRKSVILWRMHASPKETMRVTINDRLVASENTALARDRWNHLCFQWKGLTGVWAVFVNAKIHSVGQVPAAVGGNITSAATWKLHGKGVGILGDDSASSGNAWQAYGLYMTGGSVAASTTGQTSTEILSTNAIARGAGKSASSDESKVGKTSSSGTDGKAGKNSKRQAVFESDSDDPITSTGGSSSSKPFQWFTKSFAFVKRIFTFVIIPFFKFVRNTFFQTRSLDDTVVDVSETHLTVSDVKFEPPIVTENVTAADPSPIDDLSDDGGVDNNNAKRRTSASKRETDGDGGRCSGGVLTDDERVTDTDLVAVGTPLAVGGTVSSAAKRYLRVVTDVLNDVGVNVAFVRRTFACCTGRRLFDPRADVIIDWDRSRAHPYNVTLSPHSCGRI